MDGGGTDGGCADGGGADGGCAGGGGHEGGLGSVGCFDADVVTAGEFDFDVVGNPSSADGTGGDPPAILGSFFGGDAFTAECLGTPMASGSSTRLRFCLGSAPITAESLTRELLAA